MQSPAPRMERPEAAPPGEDSRAKARLQVAVTLALACINEGAPETALDHIRDHAAFAATTEAGCYVFGLIYFNANRMPQALDWFDRALALQPNHAEALAGRGVILQKLGRPGEALGTFERLLRLRPDDAEARYLCGVMLQSLGRHDEALLRYDEALIRRPAYPEALINRGALLEQCGRPAAALDAFDKALAHRPGDGMILFNRGAILQKLGRYEEALNAYERAAACGLSDPENALNRGNVLQKLGRHTDALDSYDAALRMRPAYPQAHYNRGIALQALGRVASALAAYDAALAIEPNYPEALCNRGNVLHELGRFPAALAAYDAALLLKPDLVQALTNRANVLLQRGRAAEAIASCDAALRLQPANAQAACLRGAALQKEGRLAEALQALENALAARPTYLEALLNRGNVLQELGRLDDAIASYDVALRLNPSYAEALSGRGVALKELGQVDAARACFDAALLHKPDYPDARNNRAGAHLLKGDLTAGFEDYESRWDRSNAPQKAFHAVAPIWAGEPLAGRAIIVWDEQGLGDLIQFSRFLPMLTATGADVTFLCRRSMHRLMRPLGRHLRIVESADGLPPFPLQCPLLSLPRAFKTTLATLPPPGSYLQAEPERAAMWARRLGAGGFKIGICWHGNTAINLERDVPLAAFAALARQQGVRLISLVKAVSAADAATCAALGIETLGADFDAGPDAFVDTAAVMATLDLVVTSDTAIAHLAGALGVETFVALKHVADWRWFMARADSPWYPTARLFRQPARGAWAPVFDEIAACVAARHRPEARAAPLHIPAAAGELIDKITILEIKARAIAAPDKRANVTRELAMLEDLRTQAALNGAAIESLENELRATNAKLWGIEDALRLHEDRNDFGAPFIELARQVYKTNDRRAELKRQINALCNSAIVEEKSYAPYGTAS